MANAPGMRYRGAWSSSVAYRAQDVVASGGSQYVATASSTNQTPPNGTYWLLLGPALPIAESQVTGLVADLAGKAVTPVTSSAILDGTIVNADINASAAIAASKLAAGSPGQVLLTTSGAATWSANPATAGASAYFLSTSTGNDANNGTDPATPWQTPTRLNATVLQPGDQVFFKSGETFAIDNYAGTAFLPQGLGSPAKPITMTTYGGTDNAIITGVKQITGWSLTSGVSTVGDTSIRSLNGALLHGFMQGSEFIFPGAGTVASVTAYIDGNGGGVSSQAICAVIYADNGSGSPTGAALAVSSSVSVTAGQAAGWVTYTFSSPPHLAAGTYHLALQAGGTTDTGRVFYENSATFTTNRWSTNSGGETFGSPPSSPAVTVTTGNYSIYANITYDWAGTIYQAAYTGIIPTGATAAPTGVWATGGTYNTKTRLTKASSLNAMAAGQWWWASNVLYVVVGGNPATIPVVIESSWYPSPLRIADASGYINVQNLTVEHGQLYTIQSEKAIGPVNWTSCTIRYCGDGGGTGGGFPGSMHLFANPKGGRITGCTFTGNLNDNIYCSGNLANGMCQNYEIDHNQFPDLAGPTSDHIQVDVTNATAGVNLNFNVHHNYMHTGGVTDSPKGNFLVSSSSSITATNLHFHHNETHYGRFGCSMDVCSNTLCEYNTFYNIGDDGTGVYTAVTWPAAVYISQLSNDGSISRYNTMIRCNRAYSFLDPVTAVTNFQAYNDTIIDCANAICYIALKSTGTGCNGLSFKNLIIKQTFVPVSKMFQFRTNGTSSFSNVTVDYNIYSQSLDVSNGWWYQSTGYSTFAAWQAAGFEAHTKITDPRFVAEAEQDYRILPVSPARSAGTPILNSPVVTQTPDIGSYQYVSDIALQASTMASGVITANDALVPQSATGGAVTTALSPTFYPIKPPTRTYTATSLAALVTATVAASTIGAAIYSVQYTAAGTFTATLVGQLNAVMSGSAATGVVKAATTTGAAGSGALPLQLDFTTNEYVVGVMASTVTTLTLAGAVPAAGLGALKWTAAARSSTTDWPASFTQASAGAISTSRVHWAGLVNADGAFWL